MSFYINQEILNIDSLIDESGNFNEDLKIVTKVFKDICKNIIEKLSYLEELKKNVKLLVTNRKEWLKWHDLALEGVKRFDAEKIKDRIKTLI